MPRIKALRALHLTIAFMVSGLALVSATPRWRCVIELRGKTVRTWAMGAEGHVQQRSVSEDFQYSIPGFFQEQPDPQGGVFFEFTADEKRKADRRARNLIMDMTTTEGSSKTLVVEASSVNSVPNWRFESPGRGQRIYPAKVEIMLQGTLMNPPKQVNTDPGGNSRPVYSIPMLDARATPIDFLAPSLQFQGLALWALANAKGPFTASASIEYRNAMIQNFQKLNGTVMVNFIFTGIEK